MTDACACWTWINKFSRFGSTAKIYSTLVAIEQTGMGDMLLQQPFPDPLSVILGRKAFVERPGLDISEATATRQPGEDGNEAVPEQSVDVATGGLHIPGMATLAVLGWEGLCCCQLCYGSIAHGHSGKKWPMFA